MFLKNILINSLTMQNIWYIIATRDLLLKNIEVIYENNMDTITQTCVPDIY